SGTWRILRALALCVNLAYIRKHAGASTTIADSRPCGESNGREPGESHGATRGAGARLGEGAAPARRGPERAEPERFRGRERAGQDQQRRVASCFVLVDRVEQTIAGFYTLSAAVVVARDLQGPVARRLPRYPHLPAILLGRLAVDRRYQGRGLGARLLVDA